MVQERRKRQNKAGVVEVDVFDDDRAALGHGEDSSDPFTPKILPGQLDSLAPEFLLSHAAQQQSECSEWAGRVFVAVILVLLLALGQLGSLLSQETGYSRETWRHVGQGDSLIDLLFFSSGHNTSLQSVPSSDQPPVNTESQQAEQLPSTAPTETQSESEIPAATKTAVEDSGSTATLPQAHPSECSSEMQQEYEERKIADKNSAGNKTQQEPEWDKYVPITVLNATAESKGKCLDGSLPAFHWRQGRGAGAKKWVIFLERGQWCADTKACDELSRTPQGSSQLMWREVRFGGILSQSQRFNPFFFDWNAVLVRACSGDAFGGTNTEDSPAGTGFYILREVLSYLFEKLGLRDATHVLLAGEDSGGLGALWNCDSVAKILRSSGSTQGEDDSGKGTKLPLVKCLSDSAFFLEDRDSKGREFLKPVFESLFSFHRLQLSHQCVGNEGAEATPGCLFPEHFLKYTTTPYFVLNSLYDHDHLSGYVPASHWFWTDCLADLRACKPENWEGLELLRASLVKKVTSLVSKNASNATARGAYLYSCNTRARSADSQYWHGPGAPHLGEKSPAEAVAEWFYGCTSVSPAIDCTLPCDPSCYAWW